MCLHCAPPPLEIRMPRVPPLHSVTYLLHALPAIGTAAKRQGKRDKKRETERMREKNNNRQLGQPKRDTLLRIDLL